MPDPKSAADTDPRSTAAGARSTVGSDLCGARIVHLDRVHRAREEARSAREIEDTARVFKALGDPTRLRILLALRGGEMCVCDLAAYLAVTESAVSHQLRRLREQRLVRRRREGQILYYTVDDDHLDILLDVGLDHARE